jgi:sortase (surface protein transpeptidase)
MSTLSRSFRSVVVAAALVAIASSCGGGSTVRATAPDTVPYSTSPVAASATLETATTQLESSGRPASGGSTTTIAAPVATIPLSPLASAIKDLPSALYQPTPDVDAIVPTAMSIPSLGVNNAPVVAVSVDANDELDVPDPKVVGWYEHSPAPGTNGASVLASHVDFNGVPGVFFYLSKLAPGASVVVTMSDATVRKFVVREVSLFDKDELPTERVWAKTGDPSLVLFTCGGRFNSARRSFEDNIVAFADPVDRTAG